MATAVQRSLWVSDSKWFNDTADAKATASFFKSTVVIINTDTCISNGLLTNVFSPDYGAIVDDTFTLDESGVIPVIDTANLRGIEAKFAIVLYSSSDLHFSAMVPTSDGVFTTPVTITALETKKRVAESPDGPLGGAGSCAGGSKRSAK